MIERLTTTQIKKFRKMIYGYYHLQGRHDMPWRTTRNPYHILVSEVMLQQTPVDRVTPRYREFIRRFPTIRSLARAPLRSVLGVWSGLGYNRRALALRRTAEVIRDRHHNRVPSEVGILVTLPGIGAATAAAIRAYAFNLPAIVVETNIRTVFIHCFGGRRTSVTDREIVPLIEQTVDVGNSRRWFWALMDYGALLKKKFPNPSRRSAHYARQNRFAGSNRQARGMVVKALAGRGFSLAELGKKTGLADAKLKSVLTGLRKDGLVAQRNGRWSIGVG